MRCRRRARRFSSSTASDATSDVSLVVEFSAQIGQAHALSVVVARCLPEGRKIAREALPVDEALVEQAIEADRANG